MKRLTTYGAVVAAVVSAGAMFAASAHAADDCKQYAQQSAKQVKENAARNCGLTGDFWIAENMSKAWCESVAPDVWLAAIQERQKQLESCK